MTRPLFAIVHALILGGALAAQATPSVCALAFERIRTVTAALDSVVADPVLNPRWVRRATAKIYNHEIRPQLNALFGKPGREWTAEEGALAAEVIEGMKGNPLLREHADLSTLVKRRSEWANWEAFVQNPLEHLAHGNRAKKGWDRLSFKARRLGAVALDQIRQNPQVGEMKTSFPNRLRFHKFFGDGVTYIVAYEVGAKDVHLIAVGPHENFYDGLSDLRQK